MNRRYLRLLIVLILAAAAFAAIKIPIHEPNYSQTEPSPIPEASISPEPSDIALESPTPEPSSAPTPSAAPTVSAAPSAIPDTVPAAEQAPEPTELSCTLSVSCETILNNLDKLKPEKRELVPANGVILSERRVTFNEGESVFNLLRREMKKNGIHMEFVNTPMYQSAYIEGIANLYEFDCGELSGWMYRVNSEFPNYGCSRYMLKDGDRVEWVYTCDLGKDVGGAQGGAAYE